MKKYSDEEFNMALPLHSETPTKHPLSCHTVLRDVLIDDHRLIMWQTGRRDHRDSEKTAYRLITPDGHIVFEGDEYSVGMGQCFDSDDAVRGLVGFLTCKPGDTDPEYFADYTPAQLEWVEAHAEDLSCYAMDPEDSILPDSELTYPDAPGAYLADSYPDR